MTLAYVLINTELGQNSTIETDLKEVPEVKEIYAVYGVYDFIVKLEAANMSELKNIVTNKIRRMQSIRSSLTLITFE